MASQQGVIGSWLVGQTIIIYRIVTREQRPPVPGELLGSSGLFLLLMLLAIGAPSLAVTIGVGVDIAALMNLAGSGQIGRALSGPAAKQRTSSTPAPDQSFGAVPPQAIPYSGPNTGGPGGPPLPLPPASSGQGIVPFL